MSGLLIPKVLALISAVGVAAAVVVIITSGSPSDRCFDRGTFVTETRTADGLKLVVCKTGPEQYVVLDSQGNQLVHEFLLDEARQRNAELRPSNPEVFQELFVPPEVPPEALTAARQGCDPGWVTTESTGAAGVLICHPSHWDVRFDDEDGLALEWDKGLVFVGLADRTYPAMTGCLEPPKVLTLETAGGPAELCARQLDYWGRQWGLTLPSGRAIFISIVSGGTPQDQADALRAAANIQSLP